MKVVYKDLIESAKMYSYGKCNRVVQLKLKVGVVFNIVIRSTTKVSYHIIEDSIAEFNTNSLQDSSTLLTIDDKKQVVFKNGTSGSFDWNGMWKVMDEHNLIMKLENKK